MAERASRAGARRPGWRRGRWSSWRTRSTSRLSARLRPRRGARAPASRRSRRPRPSSRPWPRPTPRSAPRSSSSRSSCWATSCWPRRRSRRSPRAPPRPPPGAPRSISRSTPIARPRTNISPRGRAISPTCAIACCWRCRAATTARAMPCPRAPSCWPLDLTPSRFLALDWQQAGAERRCARAAGTATSRCWRARAACRWWWASARIPWAAEEAILDADEGLLITGPEGSTRSAWRERLARRAGRQAARAAELEHRPAVTAGRRAGRGDGQCRRSGRDRRSDAAGKRRRRAAAHRVPVHRPRASAGRGRAVRGLSHAAGAPRRAPGDHPHPRRRRRQALAGAPSLAGEQPVPRPARPAPVPRAAGSVPSPAPGAVARGRRPAAQGHAADGDGRRRSCTRRAR